MKKILYEGAEAKIFQINDKTLQKIRLEKKYRIKEIDIKLRKQRTKREFKILTKLFENNVNVPKPLKIEETKFSFEIEYLKGKTLKNTINEIKLKQAFKQIIRMHNTGIVHGDLTTLNIIDCGKKIFLIDFGLGQFSQKAEDRAVDLHMFWNCIKNEHNDLYKFKDKLIKKYDLLTLEKLEKLEKRGRNK